MVGRANDNAHGPIGVEMGPPWVNFGSTLGGRADLRVGGKIGTETHDKGCRVTKKSRQKLLGILN